MTEEEIVKLYYDTAARGTAPLSKDEQSQALLSNLIGNPAPCHRVINTACRQATLILSDRQSQAAGTQGGGIYVSPSSC